MRQLVHSVHHRRRSSAIVRDWLPSASFRHIIGFWAETSSFWFCAMQPGNQAAETAGSRWGARTKEENEVRSRWTMKVG